MTPVLLVFLGAGRGGVLRHGVNLLALRLLGPSFPSGTLAVNLVGCLAMGLLAGWLAARLPAPWTESARLLLGTGLLGGFTTFSAFSLDAALLWERGAPALAGVYVAASALGSLAALALWVARHLA